MSGEMLWQESVMFKANIQPRLKHNRLDKNVKDVVKR
jgi:hypothetical protein